MIIGFVLLSFSSWCQNGKLTFENTNLHDVIVAIEKETNYVFNYEPSLLKEHTYSGKLNFQLSQADLTDLLFDSPFLYELDATTIIIYLPEPTDYRVCGTLRDALSQSPLIAANIYVQELDSGVQSDEYGFFDLSISGYKNQKITMSYIGYESISFTLQELDKDTCIDYALGINDNVWGKEIVVTDYILDGITEGEYYGGYNLDYNQLSKYHSTVEHDILKTAQLLPGIHSFDESATNLQFRGGSPDQNLILWEGTTLYQTGHLFGMISAINPFSVNEINIFKNTYDPSYDNRIGGIIDISLSDSLSTKSKGSVGATLTEAHVNLELPIISDKFSVLLSGRHSINAIYNSPPLQSYTSKVFQYNKIDDQSEDAQEGFINAEQVLRFHDWNAKVLYRPTDRVFVRAGMYANNQRFQYNLSFPDDPWIATDDLSVYTSAVHAHLDWQASHNLTTSISVQKSEYNNTYDYKEIELGEQLTRYDQSNAIEDKSLTWSNSYKYSNNLSLSAGYNYNRIDVNYEVDDTESYEPLYSDRSTEAAHFHNVFASADYSYHRLKINGGVRISRYVEEQEWVYSPRLNLQFSLSKNLKLKSEAGIFHQFISQLDEFGTNALQVDNPLWVINTSVSDTYHKAKKYLVASYLIIMDG